MPENLTDRNKCHKCHKTGERKKDKLSKCGRCQSITYCSKECQREDWPRHSDNCVPVMVKEYGEKGRGLVAAKEIKMGELILTDKAVVSKDDLALEMNYGWCCLTPDAERLLINQKILKDISILNHSCAPNAAMGLLDLEENEAPESEMRFELRAVKDISKEEEVTIFYPTKNRLPWFHVNMRETIQENFGFDCKCPVCSGAVPNQDDIMLKILDIAISNPFLEVEMTLLDWSRQTHALEAIVEAAKSLYMGREEAKLSYYVLLFMAGLEIKNQDLLDKALDGIKELAEKTGLEVLKQLPMDMENLRKGIE